MTGENDNNNNNNDEETTRAADNDKSKNTKLLVSPSGKVLVVPKKSMTFDASVVTAAVQASSYHEEDKTTTLKEGEVEVELEETKKAGEEDQDHDQEQQKNPLIRHVSLELLNPVYECRTRKSSIMVAIVNLIATVCGGGVLSLPLAFKRAGIIPTTLFMIYGMLTTDFSLYILVSCARRTGGRSYGDVAKASYGNFAEVLTTIVLALMLTGSLTAYLVLVRNIWTPVLLALLPSFITDPLVLHTSNNNNNNMAEDSLLLSTTTINSTTTITTSEDYDWSTNYGEEDEKLASDEGEAIILLCLVIMGSPLLLKHNLHALRHTCYVGFSSCCLLMIAVVYRAYEAIYLSSPQNNKDDDDGNNNHDQDQTAVVVEEEERAPINWYSTDVSDLGFAFPIVVLCFLCSYNVLGVHSSLLNPTRRRMRIVLDTSMLLCFILFYMVGLCGYLYAMEDTSDNILMDFSLDDKLILVSRIGYCFTLLFGLPLITLPCRDAYRLIPEQIKNWRIDAALAKEFSDIDRQRRKGAHLVINGVDFDETEAFLVTDDPEKQHVTMLTYGATHSKEHIIRPRRRNSADCSVSSTENDTDNDDVCGSDRSDVPLMDQQHVTNNNTAVDCSRYETFWHYFTTLLIVGFCYYVAISVPGVGFVWSLCGSSMAILIAFIVPTACYLKIREHKVLNPRSAAAMLLLAISCFATVVCTQQALQMNS